MFDLPGGNNLIGIIAFLLLLVFLVILTIWAMKTKPSKSE